MTSTRIKRLSVNLTVLVISLILVAAAGEVFLRLFGSPKFEVHHQQLFVQHDPLLGWSKIPFKHARHVTIEYNVDEFLNSRGIRGPEYPYAKRPNEYRVMILGDSFVEGYSVQFEDVCSQALGTILAHHGFQDCTVINGGTGGYSTDQEYLFFQNEAHKYHPDLTVLMFYSNDVVGNTRDRHYRGLKPIFHLQDGKLTLSNVPVPEPTKGDDESETEQSASDRVKVWLNTNSRLYTYARQAIMNNYNLYLLAIKLGLARSPGENGELLPVPDELKIWARSYDAETRQAWDLTEALIARLKQAAAAAGSELLVYYIPISAAIYEDEWQATKTRYGISDKDYNIHQAAIELRALCERNGIAFIDPTDRFVAEAERLRQQNRRVYYPLDHHWTAEGHRLTAGILADYITHDQEPDNRVAPVNRH